MENKNRLAAEASLYLQQHADNPVEWYPWGEEALAKAKRENKPILLSIGYSACHWCHVMAAESFADPATAKIMNEYFVNIKVDREERPDLDKIYQLAQQLLTGRTGGWPLTMFLSSENQAPFFGGTYFPPEPRYGLPGFKELLIKIADYYQLHKDEIAQQNQRLQMALQHLTQHPADATQAITSEPLAKAQQELAESFDKLNGGFGGAPKFPHPTSLLFLLRFKAEDIVKFTLTKMAQGGIYDHIGGGFYRYTVDAQWQIPHFEKMLYDNGQLLAVYAQAASAYQSDLFKVITQETAEWVLREMTSPEGVFYATLDADAEHVEGKFYYWDSAEIQAILTPEENKIFSYYYNLQQPANFEGHWHLHITHELSQVAQQFNLDIDTTKNYLNSARHKLSRARNQRVWPGLDQKILTAWNALMIKGLALAGQTLQRQDFIAAAFRAMDFIQANLIQNGRLLACYQNKCACFPAYLDDYAFLLDAALTLLQINWRAKDLQLAITLADVLLTYFVDENGGFFFTASDQENLLQRPKSLMDEAVPAGNGIAAYALGCLGHLLGEQRYLSASEKTLRMAWQALQAYPSAHASLLQAVADYLEPPKLIILRGDLTELKQWQAVCQNSSNGFNQLVFAIPQSETFLPGVLASYKIDKEKVRAYVCSGQRCLEPIIDLAKFTSTIS